MKTDSIKLSTVIPATPEKIYKAYLNSKQHAAMTNGGAVKISAKVGSKFSAWDGYCSGKILELIENKKIISTWWAAEFPEEAEDSMLEILLEPTAKGTKLTLTQTNIPFGLGKNYKSGWSDFYFKPMLEYFSKK
ncbi:hypothetical protein LBMAG27_24480 [Bacteroidota bacterium]|nr:hypothetical protein LBMAG27_24480 [Bacteroidota bacterium]